jgi:peptidoglycan hydrolase-like protein with peptidoglycan-binding domain
MGMHEEIIEAQQKLQQDNLYHGKIDGRLGRETKQALREFQKQNGLRVTASLDRETRNSLLGTGSMGQGSTMPSTTPAPSRSGTSR